MSTNKTAKLDLPELQPVATPRPKITPQAFAGMVDRRNSGFTLLSQETLMQDVSVRELLQMLTWKRPAGSQTEEDFIQKFIVPAGFKPDGYDNYWLRVGEDPEIIWSAHTDTVHHRGGTQNIQIGDGMVWAEDSDCLGADDTAGIWLMLQMVKAGVEGMYIFHREEECGGHGSTYINKHYKEHLKSYRAIIALDRKGYGDVITHQFSSRCCSETFAKSLAEILGGVYRPDETGVFTDSANYTDNVGECTNLSVGYFAQHGPNECLDVSFLSQLRDVLVAADWSKLVFERKPGEADPDAAAYGSYFGKYNGYGYGGTRSTWTTYEDRSTDDKEELDPDEVAEAFEEMESFCKRWPDMVAAFLVANGVTTEEIDDHWFNEMNRGGGGWKN